MEMTPLVGDSMGQYVNKNQFQNKIQCKARLVSGPVNEQWDCLIMMPFTAFCERLREVSCWHGEPLLIC